MNDHLLGYLLGTLDEPTQRSVATALERDPQLQAQLDRLRMWVDPLLEDREPIAAPPGLALKTLAHVAEHICKDLPHSPVLLRETSPDRRWWSRLDVVVAAGLAFLCLSLALPALLQMRRSTSTVHLAECKNNLHQFHTALKAYHDIHGQYPNVETVALSPRNVAGMVVPLLVDAGLLEKSCLPCPGGPNTSCVVIPVGQARSMPEGEFRQQADRLSPYYAYSLGYRDGQGQVHGPGQPRPGELLAQMALMADSPPALAGPGNSPNHAGVGQNVLFQDGHVKFMTVRHLPGRDDIFRNRADLVGAGLDVQDTVLGYSSAQP